MKTDRITIRVSQDGEYRVPGPARTEAQAYYTGDKADAIDTARLIYGAAVVIKFRRDAA